MKPEPRNKCRKCGGAGVRRGDVCGACKRLGEVRRLASDSMHCRCRTPNGPEKPGYKCHACYLQRVAREVLVEIGEREPPKPPKTKEVEA